MDALVVGTLIPLDTCDNDKRAFCEGLIKRLKLALMDLLYNWAAAGDELAGTTGTREIRKTDCRIFSYPSVLKFSSGEGICLIGYRELIDMLTAHQH